MRYYLITVFFSIVLSSYFVDKVSSYKFSVDNGLEKSINLTVKNLKGSGKDTTFYLKPNESFLLHIFQSTGELDPNVKVPSNIFDSLLLSADTVIYPIGFTEDRWDKTRKGDTHLEYRLVIDESDF